MQTASNFHVFEALGSGLVLEVGAGDVVVSSRRDMSGVFPLVLMTSLRQAARAP